MESNNIIRDALVLCEKIKFHSKPLIINIAQKKIGILCLETSLIKMILSLYEIYEKKLRQFEEN